MEISHRVIELLLNRRSVRSGFDERTVPRDVLAQIVACGGAAPSSKNAQPWRFHVVTDRSVLRRLAAAAEASSDIETYVPFDPRVGQRHSSYKSTVFESASVLQAVPATIWVENIGAFSGGRSGLLSACPDALRASLTGYGFEMIGIGAAIENMWLAANALGLAASFLGDVLIIEREIKDALGFCGDVVGVLAVGFSSVVAPPRPMDERSSPNMDRVVWH